MADTSHNAEVEELRLESLLSNLKAIDAIFCTRMFQVEGKVYLGEINSQKVVIFLLVY